LGPLLLFNTRIRPVDVLLQIAVVVGEFHQQLLYSLAFLLQNGMHFPQLFRIKERLVEGKPHAEQDAEPTEVAKHPRLRGSFRASGGQQFPKNVQARRQFLRDKRIVPHCLPKIRVGPARKHIVANHKVPDIGIEFLQVNRCI
jgi:hypothetical protein